jgi:hypothetical protein
MTKLELIHALKESEQDQIVLKIKLKGEEKPVLAVVDRIRNHEIVLKPFTLYGERLLKTVFPVSDIEKIAKINLPYDQGIFPVFKRAV